MPAVRSTAKTRDKYKYVLIFYNQAMRGLTQEGVKQQHLATKRILPAGVREHDCNKGQMHDCGTITCFVAGYETCQNIAP